MISVLIELVQVLSSNGVSKKRILEVVGKSDTLSRKLVDGLLNRQWRDNKSAMLSLYGAVDSEGRFKVLLHTVKQKLIALAREIPLSSSDLDARRNKHIKVIHMINSAQILLAYSATNAAIELFELGARSAEENEYYQLAISAASVLEQHYASIGKRKLRDHWSGKLDYFSECARVERKSSLLFQTFSDIANESTTYSSKQVSVARETVEELKALARDCSISSVRLLSLRSQMFFAIMVGDFRAAIEVIDEGISLLRRDLSLSTRTRISSYLWQKAHCLLELREYNAAQEPIAEALAIVPTRSQNWCRYKLTELTLAMRMENWSIVSDILRELGTQAALSNMNEFWHEQLHLMQGYFAFVVKGEVFEMRKSVVQPANSFNIHNFLADSPIMSRDKEGTNVGKLVLQCALMLAEGNIEGLVTKAEALRQYRQAHLRSPSMARSSSIVKLLHLLIENDFDVEAVVRKGKKHLDRLIPTKENNFGAMEGFEPVAYDVVWSYITIIVKRYQRRGVLRPVLPQRRRP